MVSSNVSSYLHWKDLAQILKPGDLVEFRRGNSSGTGGGIYQHWAVYMGVFKGVHQVIHYSNEDLSNPIAEQTAQFLGRFVEISGNVEVQWELLEHVAGGCACRKNNDWDEVDEPLPQAEILRVAKEKVGEGGYSLATNNCEHFAHFCRYGKARSGQVQRTTATLGTAVAIGVGATAGFLAVRAFMDWMKEDTEEEAPEDPDTPDNRRERRNETSTRRS